MQTIKHKCLDIIDIQDNTIYINCTFFDNTIKEKQTLNNNIIINCIFRKVYKELLCINTFFNNINFEKSWFAIVGSYYLQNYYSLYSCIEHK